MDTIRDFRKCNKISQVALAEYLSVTQGFISQIEKGACPIPDWVISKILENPYNWDVSILKPENSMTEEPQMVAFLRELLAEKEAKIDALQGRINELIEENARLKTLLEQKGGNAPDAEHFSSADAV